MKIYKNQALLTFILLSTFLPLAITDVSANDKSAELIKDKTFLYVTPQRCVALRKGQLCYLEVNFEWQSEKKGDYCLFKINDPNALYCWDSVDNGMFYLDFQSSENMDFVLRHKGSSHDLAQTQIIVAWVYGNKKRQRSHWRLF